MGTYWLLRFSHSWLGRLYSLIALKGFFFSLRRSQAFDLNYAWRSSPIWVGVRLLIWCWLSFLVATCFNLAPPRASFAWSYYIGWCVLKIFETLFFILQFYLLGRNFSSKAWHTWLSAALELLLPFKCFSKNRLKTTNQSASKVRRTFSKYCRNLIFWFLYPVFGHYIYFKVPRAIYGALCFLVLSIWSHLC